MAQALSTTLPVLHEDLSDELALLDNENTIFSSTVKAGGRAGASIYYRPADKQLTPTLGARSEGSSVTRSTVTNHFTNREKIPGIVQEMVTTWGVSDRARVVENPAGLDNVEGEARFRALELHKNKKELMYLSEQRQEDAASVYNDEGTLVSAHIAMGASAWADSAAQPGGHPVPSAYRPPSGHTIDIASVSAFTEANLRTMLTNARKAKRKNVNLTLFGSVDYCNHLATFFDSGSTASDTTRPIRRFNQDGTSGEITSKLTGYHTAFGDLMVVPTELLNGIRNAGTIVTSGTGNDIGVTTITCVSTAGLQTGMKVQHASIPADTYIVSITNATQFVISAALVTADITAPDPITVGWSDHALCLDMEYFFEILDGLEEVDLSADGSGMQGYVKEFVSLFCSMPYVQGKVVTNPA